MFFFRRKKNNVTNFIEKNEQINLSKVLSDAQNKQMPEEDKKAFASYEIMLAKNKIKLDKDIKDLLSKSNQEEIKPINKNKALMHFCDDKNIKDKVCDFYEKDKKIEKNSLTKKEKIEIIKKKKYKMSLERASYAGFFPRFFAFLIDYIIVISILSLLPKDKIIQTLNAKEFFSIFSINIISLVIYSLITGLIFKGQSIGKIITNIKVVSDSKDDIDYLTIILRETIGKFLLYSIPILGIFIIFSNKKHHLIDYLFDTSVVRIKYLEDYRTLLSM